MSETSNKRYIRNIPAISEAEQEILKTKKVAVIGCGGLGGFAIEYLARLGVGEIIVVDGDSFDASNLNRQLLCTNAEIAYKKVDAAKKRVEEINPDANVKIVDSFLEIKNATEIISGCDLIIDALDNAQARLVLEDAAAKEKVTIIHGAVQGWSMQVAVSLPGSGLLHTIYSGSAEDASDEESKSCLVMTPACCASIQVAEALMVLLGNKSDLEGKLFTLNLNDLSSASFLL